MVWYGGMIVQHDLSNRCQLLEDRRSRDMEDAGHLCVKGVYDSDLGKV
jgi:hypothetical protein